MSTRVAPDESFQDPPQGKPEAQAAYENGYNGGLDGSGRRVLDPAGIDPADGTFADVAEAWPPGVPTC
ncbi:hypothetical protein ACIRQP_19075 [Streptomyces sp. NPDC102274]|uniref:hypothetical protein n=1 Tax=Streptomyces sp. NPDC102274 TaxID=3366151 RepID=UPI00380F9A2F